MHNLFYTFYFSPKNLSSMFDVKIIRYKYDHILRSSSHASILRMSSLTVRPSEVPLSAAPSPSKRGAGCSRSSSTATPKHITLHLVSNLQAALPPRLRRGDAGAFFAEAGRFALAGGGVFSSHDFSMNHFRYILPPSGTHQCRHPPH